MTPRRNIRKPAAGQLALAGFGANDRPLPLPLALDWTPPDDPAPVPPPDDDPAPAVAPAFEDDTATRPIRRNRPPPAPPRVIAIRAGAPNPNPFAAPAVTRWELPPGAPCGKCGAPPCMRRRWTWGGLEITACVCCGNDGMRRPAPQPETAAAAA